jgi:vacuolar-type H+-ATPase catalytic subunit A/Vma1
VADAIAMKRTWPVRHAMPTRRRTKASRRS